MTSNIILPFKQLPVVYILLCWLGAFIFELPIDLSLFVCLYFAWLYIRLFMVTKSTPPNQIGDSTSAFALSTFFPEKAAPTIDWICKVVYKAANLCRVVDGLQAMLKKRHIAKAKAKAENRKKALEMLEQDIHENEKGDADEESGGVVTRTATESKQSEEVKTTSKIITPIKPLTDEEEWEIALEEAKRAA